MTSETDGATPAGVTWYTRVLVEITARFDAAGRGA
jgi:hypothetical protein